MTAALGRVLEGLASRFVGGDPPPCCTMCRGPSYRLHHGLCADCLSKRVRLDNARMAFERTIPGLFKWAQLSAPELEQRVTLRRLTSSPTTIARLDTNFLFGRGGGQLMFVGPSGTGKTSLAIALARAWVTKFGRPGMFVSAASLGTARMRVGWGREAEEVLEATSVPLLVLDELGGEGDVPRNPIPAILHERHAWERPTWITTWRSEAEVTKLYGDGIARRLFETGHATRLEFG
jgi:DNA replication protein DnaC